MDKREFIYGVTGGAFGTFISHPLDTARILLQAGKKVNYKNLYRGIYPPLFGIGFEKAIVFGTFYNLEKTEMNTFNKGLIAGFLSTIVVSPVEKLKILLQTQKAKKIKDLKNNVSLRNLYGGWTGTLFREVPGYGLYFTCYENIKDQNDNIFKIFLKGSVSGAFSWTFIYPADYVKTLVQNDGISYKNAISNIYNKGGILQFYKGFSYALMRCIPLHGGVFTAYEMMKRFDKYMR